ncbi:MAG: hypothetical protein D6689_13105 [Deltaproteobacteria bacterium]|nr:MAG: hypothetical protein D6689_13105 [Deltaproteobacteria bacterium]
MYTHGRAWLAALFAVALAGGGCVGDIPTSDPDPMDPNPDPDPDPNPNPDPNPQPDPESLDVTGMTMDYWEAEPLANVALETQGMIDAQGNPFATTSDATGAFAFVGVPAASTFYVRTSLDSETLAYRPTINEPAVVVNDDLVQNFYVVSEAFVNINSSTVNQPVDPLAAFVVADVRDMLGLPLEGIPAEDITLTDALGNPMGTGPYFFGATGILDLNLLATTAYDGKARIAFLNVPAGTYTLTVLYPDPADPAAKLPMTVSITTEAGGANLARVGGMGNQPPTGGGGAYSFVDDVYPILQKASLGGVGCANCHSTAKVANFLRFDEDPALVYNAMLARPGVINILDPAQSMLLTKPLYEDPPNHPNATFLDMNDPNYMVILRWIEQGAPLQK